MTALAEAFKATCCASTMLHWIVDQDDPCLDEYRQAFKDSSWGHRAFWTVPKGPPGIVHPLNYVARILIHPEETVTTHRVFGFMGDDHRPRTPGWDEAILSAARTTKAKILYGDDLLQGERLPTAVFLTLNIVRALGYMAPPELRHLYVDDFWRDLGKRSGCLEYHPEIVIEHLHYIVGKSENDATYEQNNNSAAAKKDRVAYQLYKRSGVFLRDVSSVKELL